MEYTEFQDERNDGKVLHANDSGYQESFFESDFANQTMDMLKTNSDATECKGKRYQMIMLRISINVRTCGSGDCGVRVRARSMRTPKAAEGQ